MYPSTPKRMTAAARSKQDAVDRDSIAHSNPPLGVFPVRYRESLQITGHQHRQNCRNIAGIQPPLISPAIVEIQHIPQPDPTPASQLEAVFAAQSAYYAQSRPSTPPSNRQASGSGGGSGLLAPPFDLSARSPSTPKKQKQKPYGSLGLGTPSKYLTRAEQLEKEEKTLFIPTQQSTPLRFTPVPPGSRPGSPALRLISGPATPRARRTASNQSTHRLSAYTGVRVDSDGAGDRLPLIDYPHYEAGKVTIATEPSSVFHFVPQVFDAPNRQYNKRPMILFTKDVTGIDIFAPKCGIEELVVIFPDNPDRPNPKAITVELYYPGLPPNFHIAMSYQFKKHKPETHRKNLFKTCFGMVTILVDKVRAENCRMEPGLEAWHPVRMYDRQAFRVLGLKHICEDRYLIALGVSSKYINFA